MTKAKIERGKDLPLELQIKLQTQKIEMYRKKVLEEEKKLKELKDESSNL